MVAVRKKQREESLGLNSIISKIPGLPIPHYAYSTAQRRQATSGACEEGKKLGSYISFRIPKVLHAFGKVPVREFK